MRLFLSVFTDSTTSTRGYFGHFFWDPFHATGQEYISACSVFYKSLGSIIPKCQIHCISLQWPAGLVCFLTLFWVYQLHVYMSWMACHLWFISYALNKNTVLTVLFIPLFLSWYSWILSLCTVLWILNKCLFWKKIFFKWETDFNRNLYKKLSLDKPVMGGKSSWDVYIVWIIVGAAWIRKTCGLSINTWSPVYFCPIKNKNSSLQPRCLPLGIRQHRVTCIMGSKENSSVLVCDQINTSTDVTPSVSTPWIIVDL